MAKSSKNLLWCVVHLRKDKNWWVKKTNNTGNWDTDGLPIIDPKQFAHVLDLLDPLREYGLVMDFLEQAFIPFQVQEALADKQLRLVRVNDSFVDSDEVLFALPDVADEDASPYSEFLTHITKLRVKFLNDNVKFEQKLTIDDLEDQVRELQSQTDAEGHALHAFTEVTDILEFVPEGYELSSEEEETTVEDADEEDIDVGEGFDLDTEEKIEEDDTMHWDEEGEENEEEEDNREGDKRRR
ncbi:MAG: hypothetical protein LBD01_00780 [Puniceicoccales bacterium]|jgi:hypothetical protein|nr:hypothetical protein [Puniceicoccales bacterium]